MGAKTFVTVQASFPNMPLQRAAKPYINMQVRYMNDALKAGFAVRQDSRYVIDVAKPTWKNSLVNGTLQESGTKKSNIIPACRYGVIAAIPYLPAKGVLSSDADQTDDPYLADLLEKQRNRQDDDPWQRRVKDPYA
jgi:hypothetical protein